MTENDINSISTIPSRNILIGLDNERYLEKITRVLKSRNFSTVLTVNGNEVLDELRKRSFDLVLLDLSQIQMSGYDVCEKIREQFTLIELPVILIVDKSNPKNVRKAFDAGANDYLPMVFKTSELLARVKTHITLKYAVSQAIFNARNLESEKQQRTFAESLSDLTRVLTSTLDMNDVLHKFLDYLKAFVPFDAAMILLKDKSKYKTKIIKDLSESEQLLQFKSVVVEEVERSGMVANNRLLLKEVDHTYPENQAGSLLGVPILMRNETFGIIILLSKCADSYKDNEVGMLFSFAGQAGIAIENAKLFEEIKRLATIDGLTRIYNRRYFFELGEREFERARKFDRPLSVIMIDIDNFKKLNDNFGHSIGDEFIKFAAERSSNAIRKTDIIGRYGGEEFMILLPETTIDTAVSIAERIRKTIELEKINIGSFGDIQITVSIGVTRNDTGMVSINELLEKADNALYEAKNTGRNKVFVAD